ncbi:unnamed protein product [Strongylus vulgaris]|uniref:DUF7044 domain-containing protein n=1 Tax=Strongylus vulgaris TaxID=40348 RepID=A0A3P7JPN0_STRVU|nr:unnamed protein product [Strongylus vulgaris]
MIKKGIVGLFVRHNKFLRTCSLESAACRLPWSGVWIKGDREFNITQESLGSLGSCRSKNNDQYLLSSSTDRGDCFRCLIVFPVHENVLQYKISKFDYFILN